MKWIETDRAEYINTEKISMVYVEDYGDEYRRPFGLMVVTDSAIIEVTSYENECDAYENLKKLIDQISNK